MIHKLKPCLDQIHLKTLRRIAEDLRKAGTVAGVGIVGFILASDDVTHIEAIYLIVLGLIFWSVGLFNHYIADKIEAMTSNSDESEG